MLSIVLILVLLSVLVASEPEGLPPGVE